MSHVDVLTSDYIESVCVPFFFYDFEMLNVPLCLSFALCWLAISDHPANFSSPLSSYFFLLSPLSLLAVSSYIQKNNNNNK